MSNYTISPDDDKKQVNGSAVTSTSTKVRGGTVFALGTSVPTSGFATAQVQLGGRSEAHGSQVVQGKTVFGAFQGSEVALTSVAEAAAPYEGFCDYTLAGHGLVVGQVINVTGSTSGNVNGVQKIVAVPDANSIVTDKAYVASATAGSYQLVAGRFASMTAQSYIMLGSSINVSNGQKIRTGFGSDFGVRRSIHKMEHMYTRRVATAIREGYWNVFTGTWTTDPTVADDLSDFGNDHAATPTYAVPGELTYRTSGQQDGSTSYGVTQGDYPAKVS